MTTQHHIRDTIMPGGEDPHNSPAWSVINVETRRTPPSQKQDEGEGKTHLL